MYQRIGKITYTLAGGAKTKRKAYSIAKHWRNQNVNARVIEHSKMMKRQKGDKYGVWISTTKRKGK